MKTHGHSILRGVGLRHVLQEYPDSAKTGMPAGPSAANVLLTACHVSPYCEGRRSSGIVRLVSKEVEKATAKGEVWAAGVACGRLVLRRSMPRPPFPHRQEVIIDTLPIQREGELGGSEEGTFFLLSIFFLFRAVGRCDGVIHYLCSFREFGTHVMEARTIQKQL